jgi:hypothetical protein
LRDAQYLCWKTFRKLETKREAPTTSIKVALELAKTAESAVSEVQNVANNSGDVAGKENLQKLFSEMLYLTFVLAEHYGVNLEESFMQTIDEYILGFVG